MRAGQQGGGRGGAPMSQEMMVREAEKLDATSMVMFEAGGDFLKKNKTFTGLWIAGLLLLQFGVGMVPSRESERAFDSAMAEVDEAAMQKALMRQHNAYAKYRQTKGWFTCDATCTR